MTYSETILPEIHGLTDRELAQLHARVSQAFRQALAKAQIDNLPEPLLHRIYLPLAAALVKAAREKNSTLVVGVNGAQGSGKTTLCTLLGLLLESGFGVRVAGFSIDDLYLTRSERATLGGSVHPLLTTRGVPGTHDVAMGRQLLADLKNPGSKETVLIPVFDKAVDDRAPRSAWRAVAPPFDIILFEGWCVGATPQQLEELSQPVNTLEEQEDPHGTWCNHVNAQLAGDYARFFAEIDLLIMLEVPDMECIFAWRGLQEQKLAGQKRQSYATELMDETALRRFIMHYERLTRHMLAEMPGRANLVLRLDRCHQVEAVRINHWPAFSNTP